MYRYRMTSGLSRHVVERFNKHRAKLGNILRVEARRFLSWRGKGESAFFTDHEVIMVIGETGTARFSGCCWGYGGEGPRAVCALLKACGLSDVWAEHHAFDVPRSCDPCNVTVTNEELAKLPNKTTVDWAIDLN